jgi:hypothetical protein
MSPGKALILVGLVLVVAGIFLTFGWKIPFLGRLPGDIRIEKEHFSFYFPLTSCILISVLLSLIFWLFRR